jgi:hypothetical protein
MEPRSDPERQIEEARAHLVAHLSELNRRFRAARAQLDLPAHIAAHPLAAVGAAFAVGALLGLRRSSKRRKGQDAEGGLGKAVAAGIAALGLRLAKELVMRGATEAARGWWQGRQGAVSASEVRASYRPSVEPFLEH